MDHSLDDLKNDVDQLKREMAEIKEDVKHLKSRPKPRSEWPYAQTLPIKPPLSSKISPVFFLEL